MLLELDIRNVAIAEHVRLRFSPGLNVLTGETGAGKSIIIDALTVLLGGRADPDLVRGDAAAAQIEGVFRIDEGDAAGVRPLLEEHGIQDEDGLLIISREVPRSGRSVARVNGRAVVQAALSELGARLVDIHGQTDYLSLLRPAEHVHVLDRYAGLTDLRAEVAAAVAEVRRLRAERERIDRDARDRARRMDQLSFEINEIEAANLAPGEEEELRRERSLLANAEQLARLADAAFTALSEGGEGTAAVDALGQAAEHAAELARLDEGAADLAAQAQALQEQAADLAHAMRAYRDGVEFNPERLLEAEERLALINNLKRKYGATVEEVLAYAREARRELEGLTHSEERLEELAAEESRLLARLSELAGALSARRREAAARLAAAVERELADLRLERARFAVRFERREEPAGVELAAPPEETVTAQGPEAAGAPARYAFDRTGAERVEFLVAMNPGEPLRPLAKVASGGETARLALAMKTILGAADAVPTFVFDEVDAGLGGRSGAVVGEKLAGLAASHQVLCITHLPQVAAFGERHFAVSKAVTGERTASAVATLEGEERVEELAEMLGGRTEANRRSARELLERAAGRARGAAARR